MASKVLASAPAASLAIHSSSAATTNARPACSFLGAPLKRQSHECCRRKQLRRSATLGERARHAVAAASAEGGGKSKAKAKTKAEKPRVEVTESEEDENSRVRLTVTVPAAICADTWQRTVKELMRTTQIKGFRKGDRVPEWLLVREYGERPVKLQALDLLLQSTLSDALASVAGRALKDSEHITSNVDDLVAAFQPNCPLSYEVTVDVAPSVKWKGERPYAALQVEVEVDDDGEEAAKAAADRQIRTQLKSMGRLNISQDSGLKMGDVTIVDIEAHRITADGQKGDPILSATQKGFQLDTEEGEYLLPGMVDALIGMQRGQTREFHLTFPPTWQTESLRNLPATFTVKCQELFVRELPELTDELAEKFLPGVTTIDEVRSKVAGAWQVEQQQKRKQATLNAIVNALGEVCEMAVPNSLLEEQGRQMYGAKLIELQTEGKVRKEEVAALMAEGMVENYLRAQRDKIERQVKQALAVQEVYRLEGLQFSEEELEAEVASAEAEFKRFNQEFDGKRIREQAAEVLEGKTVLDWLASHASITYVTPSASS
ncbi:unnamed protein product [Closterium sp. NIES-53]